MTPYASEHALAGGRLRLRERAEVLSLAAIATLCASTMLVLRLPPWMALLGLLGAIGAVAVFLHPFWSLFLLVCLFFFPMEVGGFTLAQACGALTIVAGLSSHFYRHRQLRAGPFLLPLLCFGGVMLLSYLYARAPEHVTGAFRRFIPNVLLYVLVLCLVDTAARLRHTLTAFALVGASNALYGVYTAHASGGSLERASGFVGNSNHLGFLCAFATPIVFHRYVNEPRRSHRWAQLALCGLLCAGVMASASRGAAVSILAGLAVCAYQMRHRFRRIIPLVLVLAVVAPFAPEVFYRRVSTLGKDVEHSVDIGEPGELTSRGYLHKSGLRVWRDHPFLGVGVGNFGKYFATTDYNPGWARGREMSQHSLYLRVLVDNGLLGALIFAWLFWRLGAQLWSLHRASSSSLSPPTRAAAEGLICSTVIFGVMALSSDFLYTHELYILLPLVYLANVEAKKEASSAHLPQAASSL